MFYGLDAEIQPKWTPGAVHPPGWGAAAVICANATTPTVTSHHDFKCLAHDLAEQRDSLSKDSSASIAAQWVAG